uniref:Uncharacterized protein n=1 Tax=Sphaerodactylus townsendi TaxID=933632 RepID=A0ACB8F938_9SAUR
MRRSQRVPRPRRRAGGFRGLPLSAGRRGIPRRPAAQLKLGKDRVHAGDGSRKRLPGRAPANRADLAVSAAVQKRPRQRIICNRKEAPETITSIKQDFLHLFE